MLRGSHLKNLWELRVSVVNKGFDQPAHELLACPGFFPDRGDGCHLVFKVQLEGPVIYD